MSPDGLVSAAVLQYAVVGSGSSANAYVFRCGDFAVVVDNGFTLKELGRRLDLLGIPMADIRFILLTHIHSDHLRGVGSLSRRIKAPVVVRRGLQLEKYSVGKLSGRIEADPDVPLRLDGLEIVPFETSHDAPGSLSYHLSHGGTRFTIITDTGIATPRMEALAGESDVLFLESNYCPDMLRDGPYPVYLKRRIASDRGHLSNPDALAFLERLRAAGRLPSRSYLCHLSSTNNAAELLERLVGDRDLAEGCIVCPKSRMQPGLPPEPRRRSGIGEAGAERRRFRRRAPSEATSPRNRKTRPGSTGIRPCCGSEPAAAGRPAVLNPRPPSAVPTGSAARSDERCRSAGSCSSEPAPRLPAARRPASAPIPNVPAPAG